MFCLFRALLFLLSVSKIKDTVSLLRYLYLAYLIFKGTSGVVLPGSSVAIMEVITFQARRFQLTLNKVEHYDEVKDYITSRKPFKYLLSCKEEAPTPVIVKCGNFKVQGDVMVQTASSTPSRPVPLVFYILFVPEGVGISDSLVTTHPEWIMGWTVIDATIIVGGGSGTTSTGSNRFSISTRLKRNLNSGDSVVAILQSRDTSATAQCAFTCQFWTCAN